MLDGLANEHAIKRIPVQCGQFMEVENRLFMQRERGNPVPVPLFNDKALDCPGEGKPAKGMFYGKLPDGYSTE